MVLLPTDVNTRGDNFVSIVCWDLFDTFSHRPFRMPVIVIIFGTAF